MMWNGEKKITTILIQMNNRGLHCIFITSCAMKIFKEIMIKKSEIFTKSKVVEAKRLLEL